MSRMAELSVSLLTPAERFCHDGHLAHMTAEVRHIVVAAEVRLGDVAWAAKQNRRRGAVTAVVVDQISASRRRREWLRGTIDLVELVHDRVRISIDRIDPALRLDHARDSSR